MFILKTLALISDKFNICKKDDKIISFTVTREFLTKKKDGKFVKEFNRLTFVDSLLLLPSSLKNLGKAFGVEQKGEYDHNKTDACKSYADFENIRK